MPIKPRNPNNVRSSELGAAHEDHEHAHADLTGVTSDQHHAEAHSVASHNDTTATGAELETLTDGSDADSLHAHASLLANVVEDTTPQLGGELDADGNNIIKLADVTFKTGATGGTLRTGTSNADKFELQAYDVDGSAYQKVLEVDAGNEPQLEVFADSFAIWDNTDESKQLFFTLSGGTTGVETEFIMAPTANRQITFPDATGTLELEGHSHVESDVTDLDHDDTDAIHDNVAGEIAAITDKATPAAGDHFVIEDSAASDAKKSLEFSSLEGAIDHGSIAGLTDDGHTQYLNDTRHAAAHGALKAELSANQSISDSVFTTIDIDTIVDEDDPDGDMSLNVSTGVITFANAGWYMVTASIAFSSNSTGERIIRLIKNGTTRLAMTRDNTNSSSDFIAGINTVAKFAAGETVEVDVFQSSGGNINVRGDDRTNLVAVKLREA